MGTIEKRTIAIIPARGGSKGVPGKNIRNFRGKPLLVHSIEYALNSVSMDEVFVSTDDAQIARIAESAGAGIIERPEAISGDTATTESAVAHGIEYLENSGVTIEIIALLQATSPLRPVGALDAAMTDFLENGCDSLLSISPTHRFFWQIDGKAAVAQYDFMNRPRRQDMLEKDIRYVENGSFYLFTLEHFRRTGNRLGGKIGYHILPEIFAHEIDTEADFLYLENLTEKYGL